MSSLQMWLRKELPFVNCRVEYEAKTVELEALIDTGSAGTMLSSDVAEKLGLDVMTGEDAYIVYGIGGEDSVYTHHISRLVIGNHAAIDLIAEIGAMNYGIQMDAIIGADVLQAIGAVIRMRPLLLEFGVFPT